MIQTPITIPGDLGGFLSTVQVFGYPGALGFVGYKIWAWYTNTKHPEDRMDRAAALKADTEYKQAWLVAQQEHTKELQAMRQDLNDVMLMLSYGQPDAVAAMLKHKAGG